MHPYSVRTQKTKSTHYPQEQTRREIHRKDNRSASSTPMNGLLDDDLHRCCFTFARLIYAPMLSHSNDIMRHYHHTDSIECIWQTHPKRAT